MCGRFTQSYTWDEILTFYGLVNQVRPDLRVSWNVAPTQTVGVIVATAEGRLWRPMRWGLVPFWAKDMSVGNRLINARADTAAVKPAFRSAFVKRRCVVPISGFYEWHVAGKHKTPYFITSAVHEPLTLAGLWEAWASPADGAGEGERTALFTCTILTTEANATLRPIHDRMPVILGRADIDGWLTQGEAALLRPCPAEWLAAWPVSVRVNSPKNDGSDLVAPTHDLFG